MNSRSWRNDELGQLITQTLHETVGDAKPSPQVWLNIKDRLAEQEGVVRKPRRWPTTAIPSLQASLALVLLLVLVSTLPWKTAPGEDDGLTIEPTTQVASSVSPLAITIDHPSEPSPIAVRARDMAIRRALASAVNRGVFEGTLRRSSSQLMRRQDTTPVQEVGLTRVRD